jgi:hypothetical protein
MNVNNSSKTRFGCASKEKFNSDFSDSESLKGSNSSGFNSKTKFAVDGTKSKQQKVNNSCLRKVVTLITRENLAKHE